jgi:EmrB/QacA subfamily drug resistance transporter
MEVLRMAAPSTGHPRRWSILAVLVLALFALGLDNTILTIALPTLARELSASTSDLQWMVDAYILVFAGFLLVAGALSDRYGRRRVLVIGLGIFGLGALIAPFVGTATQLIALRGMMGFGAALAMPSTLSIIADVFPADERPKAIAAWGGTSALGIVLGPILGGLLLQHFAWGSVFLVNLPFVIVGIVATLLVVPESRAPVVSPLDPVGAVLSIVGLVSLIFGIIEGPGRGWDDPLILASLLAAAILGVLFVTWERRSAHPMLDVRLFRDRRFSAASLSVTLSFFALNGSLFFMTLYLQAVRGLSALDTGLRFIPIAVGIAISSPLSARATTAFGARIVTAAGLLLVGAGLGLFARMGVGSGDLEVAACLILIAAGLGFAMTPATDAIMGALPADKLGVGSAVNDTTRQVGGALGVAILGSLFSASYAAHMQAAAAGLPAAAAGVVRDSLPGAAAVAAQIGGSAGQALLGAARTAFITAMDGTSVVAVGVALTGAALAALFLPSRAAAVASAPADPIDDLDDFEEEAA